MDIVLNTFGVSLSRDQGGFLISSAEGKQHIPVDNVSSFQIGKGVLITSDALLLAISNNIQVIFITHSGHPAGRVWSSQYGSISTIRKGQLNFSFSPDAVQWIKEIVAEKVANQQALLLMMQSDDDRAEQLKQKSINRLEDYRTKILHLQGEVVPDIAAQLRGWEGVSSKIYFETLNAYIPEHLRFIARSQHPAKDVINAMLNYGYGILYGKIEGELIKAGIDPYVGIFHRDDYNRPVLVYDIIEKYRAWIDYVVYSIAIQEVITEEYYSIRSDGSFWLEGLGKRILIQSINDYLEEVIPVRGHNRSRQNQIVLYCQSLAKRFKRYM